ncbi:hypothetical protein [Streptococcus thoraltensis]|uniref:hypothetical protein n=1 Tax=Streptococcus thoraltensis TaxID=55085 RepID=UPI001F56FB9D|nr:hypothetical protein [Streptococcus thoraltensis]
MKPKRYPYSGKIKPSKANQEQNALQLEIGSNLEERLDTLFHNRKAILNRMKGK